MNSLRKTIPPAIAAALLTLLTVAPAGAATSDLAELDSTVGTAVVAGESGAADAAGSRHFDATRGSARAKGDLDWAGDHSWAEITGAAVRSGKSGVKAYASVRYRVGTVRSDGSVAWESGYRHRDNIAVVTGVGSKSWSWTYQYSGWRVKDVQVNVCHNDRGWYCSAWS